MLMLLLTPGVASQSTTTETESELFQSSFRVQFFALLSFLFCSVGEDKPQRDFNLFECSCTLREASQHAKPLWAERDSASGLD